MHGPTNPKSLKIRSLFNNLAVYVRKKLVQRIHSYEEQNCY